MLNTTIAELESQFTGFDEIAMREWDRVRTLARAKRLVPRGGKFIMPMWKEISTGDNSSQLLVVAVYRDKSGIQFKIEKA